MKSIGARVGKPCEKRLASLVSIKLFDFLGVSQVRREITLFQSPDSRRQEQIHGSIEVLRSVRRDLLT